MAVCNSEQTHAITGYSTYILKIQKIPFLSPEEESALALAWHERQDAKAMRQLIGAHLRLVVRIARGYSSDGIPVSELVAEGNLGLMLALQNFYPHRGFRFSRYARSWVRAAIISYLLRSWSVVRVGTTSAQRKLFFNLRRLKRQKGWDHHQNLDPAQAAELARTLGVSVDDVVQMDQRLQAPDFSVNTAIDQQGYFSFQDMLTDDVANQEESYIDDDSERKTRKALATSLAKLKDRERDILIERRLVETPATLEVLSQRYGVSGERIRQVEKKALRKLSELMRAECVAAGSVGPGGIDAVLPAVIISGSRLTRSDRVCGSKL